MPETLVDKPATSPATEHGPSPAVLTVFTVAAAALVANLYYAQPLIAAIGPAIGIKPEVAGAVVSVTQIGYGIGLFFLVSLADLVENRRLVLVTLGLTTLGLVGVATAQSALVFFAASFVVGLCTTGAQVLLPTVAQLAPPQIRGRVVGFVMAGLLTGIMLARPVALFAAASFGWRSIFWISVALMVVIAIAIARVMPRHKPAPGLHYGQILASMIGLLKSMPAVRLRAAYQGLMFCAFNMFWTAVPLMLADRFNLSQAQIGLFALAGSGGALAAPLAGRLADRGWTRAATLGSILTLGLAFFATRWSSGPVGLAALVVLTVLIDAAVQTNQVVGQRTIFSVEPAVRGRVNAIYMCILFACGAVGSVLGTLTYHWGGWSATATTGGLLGAAMAIVFVLGPDRSPRSR